jgi:TonB-linked SusC/RagA family outer membrane protein
MLLILFIGMNQAFAQVKTVTGTITSGEEGQPLAGVSVLVKGTFKGTSTNANGKFSLSAKEGSTLIVSYTNYISKEIPVTSSQQAIDIVLEKDSKSLSEVVVTAFGIERQKRSVGYAQQKVDGSALTLAREPNVLNSLKGRAAGVFINQSSGGPSGSSYISIRGNSSLAGNNQPLFVVDGYPINNSNLRQAGPGSQVGSRDYGDGIKDINPDDIESITVLKGANAAALYGSRGANGVILITTKKSSKKGLGVTYNSNVTIEKLNVTPTFQNKWAGGYGDAYEGTWIDSTTYNGQRYQLQNGTSDAQYGGPLDGRLAIIELIPELGPIPMSPQPADNVNSLYRTGSTFTNSVSLTGGNETSNVRLSLSNLSNKGIIPNNSFNRQTVNLVAATDITDRLKVEAKANYIRESNKNRPIVGASYANISRSFLALPRNIDLNWLKDYRRDDGSMVVWLKGDVQNPFWSMNEIREEDQRDRIIGYVSLNYKFTNWLSMKIGAANDSYTDVRNERVAKGTPDRNGSAGNVRNYEFHVNELNTDAILMANGKLSKNFTGSLLVGGNLYKTKSTTVGLEGGNLNYPDFYNISNAGLVTPVYSLARKEVQSVFYNGQLGYKNYLFLDVTGRNDWSSSLGQPSFFYPSFSLSHVLTDALNIKSDLLSYVKLRASYAQAGTDANIYLTKGGYTVLPLSSGFNGQQFAQVNQSVPNATLKNELKKSYEFGTDIRLFNNRMGIDFTYYKANTSNQILPISISAGSGFSTKLINAGEIQNKGVELFVNAIPVQSKSFTWEISVNAANNKSKVVSLAPGITSNVMLSTNYISIEARPGQPFGNIIGYPFKRTPEGRKIIEDGTWARGDDRVVLGNIQPDWLGGISNTFSYKGIRLSALIDVRKGGQIYSNTKDDEMGNGTGKFTENRGNLIAEGVVWDDNAGKYVENTQKIFSEQYYAYQSWLGINEAFVIDADYAALREATIGYEFKPKILSKTPFKTATFSVVGRNLFYLYRNPQFKVMGISPESAFAPTAAAQGYEAISMPTTRSFGFNLSLSF